MAPIDLEIVDNPAERRYEARLAGDLVGLSEYRQAGSRRIVIHTEVAPEHEGKGIGARLARGLLDDIRARGFTLTPRCPFVRAFVERHPEYADLVAGAGRADRSGATGG
jgi:predicted GNAT family acetyltransferase